MVGQWQLQYLVGTHPDTGGDMQTLHRKAPAQPGSTASSCCPSHPVQKKREKKKLFLEHIDTQFYVGILLNITTKHVNL